MTPGCGTPPPNCVVAFPPEHATDPAGEIMSSEAPSPVLDALWEKVEQRWDEPNVHESFLVACAEEDDLAFGARKYREQKDGPIETRHEFAQAQLDKITTMALSRMSSLRTPPEKNKRAITILAAVVSGGLILACIYLLTL